MRRAHPAQQGRGKKLTAALAILRTPRAFDGGARSIDGGEWLLEGKRRRLNPAVTTPPAAFHVVKLWNRCRGGMGGFAVLPEPGGLNAQPAWLLEAFAILTNADAEAERQAAADAEPEPQGS